MADYSFFTKTDSRRNEHLTVSLVLEGYQANEYWNGEIEIVEYWPLTALEVLIHLCTGRNRSDTDESVEIPDVLGWHIAHLMDLWTADLGCTFEQDFADAAEPEESPKRLLDLSKYMAFASMPDWMTTGAPTDEALNPIKALQKSRYSRPLFRRAITTTARTLRG